MDSSGMLLRLLCISLLSIICSGQTSQEVSAEDTGAQNSALSTEKELVEALEALLKFQTRPSTEKRGVASCGIGARCAMRLGPRFGKLCECGRGSSCNSFLLKCI